MYPGYAVLPGAERAIGSLFGEMHDSPQFLEEVANMYDESPQQFKQAWPERAGQLNAALHKVTFLFDDLSLPSEI